MFSQGCISGSRVDATESSITRPRPVPGEPCGPTRRYSQIEDSQFFVRIIIHTPKKHLPGNILSNIHLETTQPFYFVTDALYCILAPFENNAQQSFKCLSRTNIREVAKSILDSKTTVVKTELIENEVVCNNGSLEAFHTEQEFAQITNTLVDSKDCNIEVMSNTSKIDEKTKILLLQVRETL